PGIRALPSLIFWRRLDSFVAFARLKTGPAVEARRSLVFDVSTVPASPPTWHIAQRVWKMLRPAFSAGVRLADGGVCGCCALMPISVGPTFRAGVPPIRSTAANTRNKYVRRTGTSQRSSGDQRIHASREG